jgi:hypothetical protein
VGHIHRHTDVLCLDSERAKLQVLICLFHFIADSAAIIKLYCQSCLNVSHVTTALRNLRLRMEKIQKLAVNIWNRQSRTTDTGLFCSFGRVCRADSLSFRTGMPEVSVG